MSSFKGKRPGPSAPSALSDPEASTVVFEAKRQAPAAYRSADTRPLEPASNPVAYGKVVVDQRALARASADSGDQRAIPESAESVGLSQEEAASGSEAKSAALDEASPGKSATGGQSRAGGAGAARKKPRAARVGPSKAVAANDAGDVDPEDFGRYRTRTAKRFDDCDSNDDGEHSSEEDADVAAQSKLGMLKSNEAYLKKQIEQNAQMLEVEKQKAALGANADSDVKPNRRFRNFNDVFTGLTRSMNVVTHFPLVSVMITYDSKSAVTVTKKNDREYYVK